MTTHERIQAVAGYGFTDRQARFLVLVMRHAGLCVKRQYAAFAGIAPGSEKCHAFFAKLIHRGYAVASDCIHNRARLYHVHHKPLYHAIGEPESRYRRAVPARRATERLMRLDAALITPDLDWLTTRSEKLAYLATRIAPESSEQVARMAVQDRVDVFPGTFPIGIDATGRVVLLYLATVPWTDDFRLFLVGHLRLFSVFRSRIARCSPDRLGSGSARSSLNGGRGQRDASNNAAERRRSRQPVSRRLCIRISAELVARRSPDFTAAPSFLWSDVDPRVSRSTCW